jgi:hypothetical protein
MAKVKYFLAEEVDNLYQIRRTIYFDKTQKWFGSFREVTKALNECYLVEEIDDQMEKVMESYEVSL